MSNKINIPTFVTDEQFTPTRVNPRLFFYNGTIPVQEYKVSALTSPFSRFVYSQTEIPYFDHYSAEPGLFPTSGSQSLLFYNENPAYGSIPENTLFTQYWSKYIELLYNPRTRLIECTGVIPLADYIDLELNDIIEWRGNHYHIRAVNNYNLETGECDIELLGPIIDDAITG
jgi:hypothetical protein